ncbi:MAG: fibronectin/fibrinogen-binding protein, partial [Clostridia bacterium]|nr:fibronectin/fibrinogen-binding protein [Clostridia bacterium]
GIDKEVPPSTIREAAEIAAYYSKARSSSQVPVDYTAIKNVKKPSGAKPGMVIYDNYNTIYVTPKEPQNK